MKRIVIIGAALFLALHQLPAAAAEQGAPAAAPQAGHRLKFQGTVELYVTSWCGFCRKAEAWLKEKKVPYVKYDIEADPEARKRFEQQKGRGVPLVIIGQSAIRGYSPDDMAALLFQ
ncbi:MAG TPA: glutaredoxin domain-containing protein [Verrucomicrobiae bacterium]|nr:glutaredoxin domain-containing protein [Verrucomicrobiae bacterium]